MGKKYRHLLPIFTLILLEAVLFATNYIPHTYLVGWDNVFSELNFKNAFKINLFSVWQQYRGLGVQDGMAHAANLIHTCFVLLLSLFLPQNLIRYVFHFLMHLFGMIGMYILLRKEFKKNAFVSTLGALFYGLNLATIQMFFAPLEVFSVHFAAIPWGIIALLTFFEKPSKKSALILFLTNVLFSPQGFVPTVFIAYLIGLFCFSTYAFFRHWNWKTARVICIAFAIILSANAFWLFPFINGAITQGNTIKNTKINQISSEEIYQKNIKRGNLADVILLKGFMLDTVENNLGGTPTFIMEEWSKHFSNGGVAAISYFLAALALLGIGAVALRNKDKRSYAPLLLFISAFFFLGTDVPGIGFLNEIIRKYIPLFGEAFRFPFTKLVFIFVFAYGILVAEGIELLGSWLTKQIRSLLYLLTLGFIFIYSFPAFSGLFFYPSIRLPIPQDYFAIISYFKNEPSNARIMTLPQSSFWNWLYYRWGERGSGFAWYGIEQPTLERPFDPWSNYNGQYFNEVVYAVQTENKGLFQNIVNKYDISYILIDDNILQTSKIQRKEKLEEFVASIYPNSQLFRTNNVDVFKLDEKPFLKKISPMTVQGVAPYDFIDTVYRENGDYAASLTEGLFYPFSSLFTNKTQPDISTQITRNNTTLALRDEINKMHMPQNGQVFVQFPSFAENEKAVFAKIITQKDTLIISPVIFSLKVGNQIISYTPFKQETIAAKGISKCTLNDEPIDSKKTISLTIDLPNVFHCTYGDGSEKSMQYYPRVNPALSQPVQPKEGEYRFDLSFEYPQYSILTGGKVQSAIDESIKQTCSEELRKGDSSLAKTEDGVSMQSRDSSSCYDLFLSNASQRQGLLLFIDTKNTSGLSLRFVVDNPQQKVNIIDTKLDGEEGKNVIIIPPTSSYVYFGYGIHFRNISLDDSLSKNSIQNIDAGTIPYSWIKGIKIGTTSAPPIELGTVSFREINPSYYIIDSNTANTVALSQSFNKEWRAYSFDTSPNIFQQLLPFLFGKRIQDHVLVNNWANGWIVNGQTNIVIVFLPQYLEYLGFGVLLFSLAVILIRKEK